MFRMMTDLVMDQLLQELDGAERKGEIEEIRARMGSNKLHLCRLLLRTPQLQDIFQNFVFQIKGFIQKEVKFNTKGMNKFLQDPHDDRKLSELYPSYHEFKDTTISRELDSS